MTHLDDRGRLVPFGEGIWTTSIPHSFLGLRFGARMTVVRLPDGGLLLHSPVPLTPGLKGEIDALGAVRHVVAPNLYHHLWAGDAKRTYADAQLHAPRRLRKKRPDLAIDRDLEAGAPDAWGGALESITIAGSELGETVLVHREARTVISADLTENFHECDHLPTRLYLQAGGVWKKAGWPRPMRLVYLDRAAARRSVESLLERDFDRVVLSHGELIERGGKDAVRGTFEFLR